VAVDGNNSAIGTNFKRDFSNEARSYECFIAEYDSLGSCVNEALSHSARCTAKFHNDWLVERFQNIARRLNRVIDGGIRSQEGVISSCVGRSKGHRSGKNRTIWINRDRSNFLDG